MTVFEDLALDAGAGYAFGRLAAFDTVTLPLANRVFKELVDVEIPDDVFLGFNQQTATAARRHLEQNLGREIRAGIADLRQLHRDGWTAPYGKWERFAADLLSCPICVSFHALWLARLATGRARPWSTRWWLRLFAGWGAAQVLLRLPAHSGAKDASMYVTEALNEAAKQEAADAVHQPSTSEVHVRGSPEHR